MWRCAPRPTFSTRPSWIVHVSAKHQAVQTLRNTIFVHPPFELGENLTPRRPCKQPGTTHPYHYERETDVDGPPSTSLPLSDSSVHAAGASPLRFAVNSFDLALAHTEDVNERRERRDGHDDQQPMCGGRAILLSVVPSLLLAKANHDCTRRSGWSVRAREQLSERETRLQSIMCPPRLESARYRHAHHSRRAHDDAAKHHRHTEIRSGPLLD